MNHLPRRDGSHDGTSHQSDARICQFEATLLLNGRFDIRLLFPMPHTGKSLARPSTNGGVLISCLPHSSCLRYPVNANVIFLLTRCPFSILVAKDGLSAVSRFSVGPRLRGELSRHRARALRRSPPLNWFKLSDTVGCPSRDHSKSRVPSANGEALDSAIQRCQSLPGDGSGPR